MCVCLRRVPVWVYREKGGGGLGVVEAASDTQQKKIPT